MSAIKHARAEMVKIAGFMPGVVGAGAGLVGVALLQKPGANQDRQLRDMGYINQGSFKYRQERRKEALLGITAATGLTSAVVGPAMATGISDFVHRQGNRLMTESTMKPLYEALERAAARNSEILAAQAVTTLRAEIQPEIVNTIREEIVPIISAEVRKGLQEESTGVGENIATGVGNVARAGTKHYIGFGWLADLLARKGKATNPTKALTKTLKAVR